LNLRLGSRFDLSGGKHSFLLGSKEFLSAITNAKEWYERQGVGASRVHV